MVTSATGSRRKPTLLLAEDDVGVARSLMRILSEYFDVTEVVTDGQTLIERVNRQRPDLIVTDVGLDGMDGLSATIAIRERHPSIPIVVLTANLDPALRRVALAVGASAFLSKSNMANELVSVLRSLLS